jgi:hypothetical protein
MTMAVGLILRRASTPIAMGREILNRSNPPTGRRLEIGQQRSIWLFWNRRKPRFGTRSSTLTVGLEIPGKISDVFGLGRTGV